MRLLGFILRLSVFLALAIGLAVWLTDQPGTARIVWHDYVIETSAAFLAFLFALALCGLFILYRLWRFMWDGLRFWKLGQQIKKLKQGQEQIGLGIVALASGDAAEAGRLAVAARKALGATASTRWLQAQAAQLAGDHATAKEIFRSLAAEPANAPLGYRGLIAAAVKERHWDEAEQHVAKLHRLKPKTPWLSLIRFELAARRQNWAEAREALTEAASSRLLEAPLARRHQAALLLANLDDLVKRGQPDQALQAAEQAARLCPDWLPALAALAHAQILTNHLRAAQRTLERAWERAPHPQLVALAQKMGRNPRSLDGYKQVEKLVRANRDHPASALALAEAALAADLWGEARRHFLVLANGPRPTQNVFRLLANLERRESANDSAATRWLMKAMDAAPDPLWLCDSCGGSHPEWQATCKHCGAFDTLTWQSPGLSRPAISGGAVEALPC